MIIRILVYLVIIAGFLFWAWTLRERKPKTARTMMRVTTAVGLFFPFLVLNFFIWLIALWGSGRPLPNPADGDSFYITNNSSIPIQVSADFAYTPAELEVLKERNIEIDLSVNFTTYDVFIPEKSELSHSGDQHHFTIPLPRHRGDVAWPSELNITLSDTSGNELARFETQDIDSTMRTSMRMIITDELLQK